MLAKRQRHGTLDREHPDQLVPDEQWNGNLALRVGQTRDRHRLSDAGLEAGLHRLAPLRRGIGALLPEVVDAQHLALLGDDTDHAGADLHSPAGGLILIAPACHHFQRLAVGLQQQDVGVVELEQLVHRPQRHVTDLVQVERRIDVGGDALQDLELGRLAGEFRRGFMRLWRLGHRTTHRSTWGTAASPPRAPDKCPLHGA